MREIKFRAWDKQRSRMLYGNNGLFMFVGTGGLGWNFADTWDVGVNNDYTLMQFTGLHDKNGKEIWEKDILRGHVTGILYIVFFEDGAYFARSGNLLLTRQDFHNNEVIGNIYENKDLLI